MDVLADTLSNIRYAARGLLRSPAFTIAAVTSLALGIGASVAVFTVADNLLIRPLPYRDPSRLVMLWEANTKRAGDFSGHSEISPGNFLDWKSRDRSGTPALDGLAGLREARSVLIDGDRAEEFARQSVTADFFNVLGVDPALGHAFAPDADRPGGLHDSILISHRLFERWFASDPSILGRKVLVDSTPRTIAGVMPANFYFLNRDIDIWDPLVLNPAEDLRKTQGRVMLAVGRLRSGVALAQAQSRMSAIAAQLAKEFSGFDGDWTIQVEALRDSMFGETKTSLLVLLAAVAMMLIVACANAANLLLARYSTRRREIAVRASLGAGRWQVIRQLLTESLFLAIIGGAAGIAIARLAIDGLIALAPSTLTQTAEIHLDTRILLTAIALSLATGIIFGIAPAFVASRIDLLSALRGGDRNASTSGSNLRGWLVAGEVSLSVILLTGATLLFRSLISLQSLPPGLDATNLLTFRVSLPPARYAQPAARIQFFHQALEQVARINGVESASAVSFPPFSGHGTGTFVDIEGFPAAPNEDRLALIRGVLPGFLATMHIPLLRGRDFTPADDQESAPRRVLINQAFVHQFLHDADPLGRRVHLYLLDPDGAFSEIIGVTGDVREWSIDRAPMPMVYPVYSHLTRAAMTFLIRSPHDPATLTEPARQIIRALDPTQPIAEVRTVAGLLGENYERQRFGAWLLSGFAIVALALAGVGIYGVLAYSVAARTREFGVRTALGADAAHISGLVLKSGARVLLGGLVAGIAGALALVGLLRTLLYNVTPRDPLTFAIVPIILAAIALLAASLPARRAARLDPMTALRSE